tara:strand:+ start:334 stop:963 length:630 start_codon:yes stop_codon:yes gene_type:complete
MCITYVRKGGTHRFHPTQFALTLSETKTSLKGNLAPGKNARNSIALFNPGSSYVDIWIALHAIWNFLEKQKSGVVEAIGIGTKKGSKPELLKAAISIDAADSMIIKCEEQLNKPSKVLPYHVVVVPTTIRHWQDLHDDISPLMQKIKYKDGLLRGYIETALGNLPIVEGDNGVWAVIKSDSDNYMHLQMDQGYFMLEDDEDEDPDDFDI